ncbi:ATPase AAA [Verrucomicrobiota bacterium]|nr:ATPase AAA [Verrucomicrobiota bacterium]
MTHSQFTSQTTALKTEIAKAIVGQHQVVDHVLQAIFAGGHCLMVGVPGLAKTLLVSTLSKALHLSFKRVQFTPDLMPTDITGSEIIQEGEDGRRHFTFIKGPLFANFVLADEINRTPPKTQAALLEAMQEHRVTVANKTYDLEEPFFVLATQNPVEQEGTYTLPEAQQDRFMYFITVDYPERAEELEVIARTTSRAKPDVKPIFNAADLIAAQAMVRDVPIASHLLAFALDFVRATRRQRGAEGDLAPDFVKQYVEWGAGPRAAQYLVLGAKARALMAGRTHVTAEDIRAVAHPVLSHRIILNFAGTAAGIKVGDLINKLLQTVKVTEA